MSSCEAVVPRWPITPVWQASASSRTGSPSSETVMPASEALRDLHDLGGGRAGALADEQRDALARREHLGRQDARRLLATRATTGCLSSFASRAP